MCYINRLYLPLDRETNQQGIRQKNMSRCTDIQQEGEVLIEMIVDCDFRLDKAINSTVVHSCIDTKQT